MSSQYNSLIDEAGLKTISGEITTKTNVVGDTLATKFVNAGDLDAIEAAEKGVQTASKVATVIGTAAVAFEVAGNALQALTSIAEYSALAYFNTTFNNTVSANLTPLKVSDLINMNQNNKNQLSAYLTNMMAGGNTIPPKLLGPTTPQSVYESL